jgi:hypothetical protein
MKISIDTDDARGNHDLFGTLEQLYEFADLARKPLYADSIPEEDPNIDIPPIAKANWKKRKSGQGFIRLFRDYDKLTKGGHSFGYDV